MEYIKEIGLPYIERKKLMWEWFKLVSKNIKIYNVKYTILNAQYHQYVQYYHDTKVSFSITYSHKKVKVWNNTLPYNKWFLFK